jgi:nucleotidyltransferase substrate binding protein (TIGR01987 family)
MNQKGTRWRQRFENFEKAYLLLAGTIEIENPSVVERAGLIQFFEVTFELSWKMLKDYLESQNVNPKFPRDTIKEAFHYELIGNGDAWMEMLNDRNLTVHTYNETKASEVEAKIRTSFFPAIRQLYLQMKERV